jgi:hypothetical protein
VKFSFFGHKTKKSNPIIYGFFFGLARILLFKFCKYGKAPKVLASRLITIFVDKEIYETKEKDKLD